MSQPFISVQIIQGQAYSDTINLTHSDTTPIDLTGATIISQIRRGPVSLGYPILASFTTVAASPTTSGVITRTLDAATTASLPLPFPDDETFFHDVFVTTSAGVKIQVVVGPVQVLPRYSA